MIRWILASSLRFGRLAVAIALGVLAVGGVQLRSAAVDVYPQFTPPTVEIQTEALGLSAAEVEQLITVPLEQDLLNGVPWLEHIHSSSMPGLSAIDLTFQAGTDIYAARQMVQERMTQAHALPNVGSPPIMIQPLASTSRVAMIGLSSKTVSLIDMSVLARWKIKPRLMGVPGVANVSVYGQRDRQLQVQVDPTRLKDHNVTLTQVIETTGNALWVSPLTFVEASTPGTGGFVESPNQRLAIQHISPISTPAQLAAVPVEGAAGGTLRLGDVAQVIEDHQPLIGDAVADGTPTLYLVIEKFPGANTLEVTRQLERAMADLAPGLKGISVNSTVYRPASYLETALHQLGLVALLGFVLLLVLLGLFASWRVALIGLVVVPLSLVAGSYVLYLRGATFTTMTLLGLAAALALILDDLVADVDAIRRRLRAGVGEGHHARSTAVIEALASVRGSLVYAGLAILLATLPFVVLGALVTSFTRPLAFSYALGLLASMLVALTVTPTLALLLLRGEARSAEAGSAAGAASAAEAASAAGAGTHGDAPEPNRFAAGVQRLFDRSAAGWAERPRRAWAVLAVLVLAALAVLPQLGKGALLPSPQDRSLLLQLRAAQGTSLTEMDRITALASADLRRLPGVAGVGAHVGRAVSSDQLVDVNSAELWVTLTPNADYAGTQGAIRAVMRDYAGVRTDLLTYPTDRLAAEVNGTRDDLVVRVYGADLDTLQSKAEQVRAMLTGIHGVQNPTVRPIVRQPAVDVQVDLANADRYGLRPGDVRRDSTTLTSGLVVGNLYEQSKIFDVVVWGTPQTRSDLTGLQNLRIDTPSGSQVALKDVATLSINPEPAAITHDDVLRSIEVVASVRGADPASVADAVKARIATMPMPMEYHAEVSGNAVPHETDTHRAWAYALAALIGVLLLLQAAAQSWRRALLLLVAAPLSVVGGVLTAPLAGGITSAGALVGLFTVLGLALRAGLLLVRRLAELEPPSAEAALVASLDGARTSADGAGGGLTAAERVRQATRDRSVPLLQTVLCLAVVMLVPAVLGSGAGLEVLHPMAVTVLGGLVSLLVVQWAVLPALLLALSGDGGTEHAPQALPAPAPEAEPVAAATEH